MPPLIAASKIIEFAMTEIENVRENPQDLADDTADALEAGGSPPDADLRHRYRKALVLEHVIDTLCDQYSKLDVRPVATLLGNILANPK